VLLIADRSNRCLRRALREDGRWFVETLAGHPNNPPDRQQLQLVRDENPMQPGSRPERFASDGVGTRATFHYLHSNVIVDRHSNAYLIDADFLRKVSPTGEVITLNAHGGTGPPAAAQSEQPLHPNDVWATVYRNLGVDPQQTFVNNAGRPIPILPNGEPIAEFL
jgi:hypothetical protein